MNVSDAESDVDYPNRKLLIHKNHNTCRQVVGKAVGGSEIDSLAFFGTGTTAEDFVEPLYGKANGGKINKAAKRKSLCPLRGGTNAGGKMKGAVKGKKIQAKSSLRRAKPKSRTTITANSESSRMAFQDDSDASFGNHFDNDTDDDISNHFDGDTDDDENGHSADFDNHYFDGNNRQGDPEQEEQQKKSAADSSEEANDSNERMNGGSSHFPRNNAPSRSQPARAQPPPFR
ncbi:MAG: hypothetical protein SGARI_002063, partial [Bacillariaceae sp.]